MSSKIIYSKNNFKCLESSDYLDDECKSKIKLLIEKLNLEVEHIYKKCFIRQNKITFKDLVYFISIMNANSGSYIGSNFDMATKFNINVDNTSFCYRRITTDAEYFKKLANCVADLIYQNFDNSNNDKYRYIAVDGSQINLGLINPSEKFKLSNNKNHSICLVHSLFDINNNFPIDLAISKNKNERNTFIEQLKYLNDHTVVIFDRGYYSKEFMELLLKNKIPFIFRCKKNIDHFKGMSYEESKKIYYDYEDGSKKKTKILKSFKYKIDKPNKKDDYEYYIITSLLKKNIDDIKYLYNKRWSVETDFKFLKYDMKLNNIKSRKEITIKQDIYISQFISTLYAYFNLLITKKKDCYVHKKKSVEITVNRFLDLIFYETNIDTAIKNISKTLNIMEKKLQIKIQKNRHVVRKRIKPFPKFNHKGKIYSKSIKKDIRKMDDKNGIKIEIIDDSNKENKTNNSFKILNKKNKENITVN